MGDDNGNSGNGGRRKCKKHPPLLLLLLLLLFFILSLLLILGLLLVLHTPGCGDVLAYGGCTNTGSYGKPSNNLVGKPRHGAVCNICTPLHCVAEIAWPAVAATTHSSLAWPIMGLVLLSTLGPSFLLMAAPA